MAQMHFDMVVIEGTNEGMRFTIDAQYFRIIGRNEYQIFETKQLTVQGNIQLLPHAHDIIQNHLQHPLNVSQIKPLLRGPDILLNDKSISSTHAMVFIYINKLCLVDLLSTNGIKVNGQSFSEGFIYPKDQIQLGSSKVVLLQD